MNKLLVDTNILIDFLRSKEKNLSHFLELFHDEQNIPVLSSVTVAELFIGESSIEEEELRLYNRLFNVVEIIYPNFAIIKKTGEILRVHKRSISFQDAEIAACAIVNNLPLLTDNKKDFAKIKGIKFFI